MIWTTTVTITDIATGDPYEDSATTTRTAIPAHVSAPSGTDESVGGDKEIVDAEAYLPAGTAVASTSRVTDTATAITYAVTWVRARRGLGLDHVHLGLRAVRGGSNG
jgi:hypothetical protein